VCVMLPLPPGGGWGEGCYDRGTVSDPDLDPPPAPAPAPGSAPALDSPKLTIIGVKPL